MRFWKRILLFLRLESEGSFQLEELSEQDWAGLAGFGPRSGVKTVDRIRAQSAP